MSGVRWHERVFVAGYTGSGKSELINHLFSRMRCQRLLVDTKPEFTIPGVEPTRSIDALDWSAPIIHYQDRSNDLDEYDELFYHALKRRHLVVAVHELADLCDDQPNRAPKWVKAYLRKGNARGCGLLGASQRPVCMPRVSRTEAQHVVSFNPPVDVEDRKIMAALMQTTLERHDQALEQARRLTPDPEGLHTFAWYDRQSRNLAISGPIPDRVRARIMVHRAVDLASHHGAQAGGREQG